MRGVTNARRADSPTCGSSTTHGGRALRERQVALKLRAERWYKSITTAAPGGASAKGSW
jgi:hypothetical protein